MATSKRKWSGAVTQTSDAMDVARGTFEQTDPKKIAREIERDAERSTRRKSTPYRSAMSMLTFYINRAGSNLSAKQRKVLEDAKDVLRAEFGSESAKKTATGGRRTATKKRPVRSAATLKKRKTPTRPRSSSAQQKTKGRRPSA